MQTVAKLNKHLPFVLAQLDDAKKDKKKKSSIKPLQKQVDNLKTAINYLKSKPKKKFIEEEIERLTNRTNQCA
jgi:Na+/phosphate symporter